MLLITNNSEFTARRDAYFELDRPFHDEQEIAELNEAYDKGGLAAQVILSESDEETRVLKRKVRVLFWLLIGALAMGSIGFYFYILTVIR